MDYEEHNDERNEFIFKGKKGANLTVTKKQLLLENSKEILLIPLESVSGFFCEKRGKYYRVRISARCDLDLVSLRYIRCLITLSLEETKKLIKILQSIRAW